tara:strand:+ start:634 stop:1308 length:675 start_codon:yes stop_codon:yes gene_type:complete
MLSQNKKKIYIINFNPKDFFDLTIEALENLKTSDLIISTRKLDKKFKSNLNKINKMIEINTELSKNKIIFRKYLISKLDIFNSISYLYLGDLNITEIFFDDNVLEKKGIKVEVKLGILSIVNLLNKKNQLLTNRNKNSSVSFFNYLDIKKILSIIEKNNFEKLLIKTTKTYLMKNFLEKLKKTKNQKYNYQLFSETKKLSPKNLSIKNFGIDNLFILIEKNEKI